MKNKILALGVIAALSMAMVACGSSSNDTKVIEATTNDAAEATTAVDSGYVFSYEGTEIPVDADVAPIIEVLGEPNSYFESPSCAADGIGKLYTYSDFEIQTYPDGDVDRVLYVLLRTDNVATAEGIDLSSSKEDIVSAYGEPSSEATGAMTYEKNDVSLVFIFDDESLISIEYDSAMNK